MLKRSHFIPSIIVLSSLFTANAHSQDIDIVDPADIAQAIELSTGISTNLQELLDMQEPLTEPVENDELTIRILNSMQTRNERLSASLDETALAIIDQDIDLIFQLNESQCNVTRSLDTAIDAAKIAAEMPHTSGITSDAEQFTTIKESLTEVSSLLGC